MNYIKRFITNTALVLLSSACLPSAPTITPIPARTPTPITTAIPTPAYTPLATPTTTPQEGEIACDANVQLTNISGRVDIRKDGLNEALEDLGLCQKSLYILVEDLPGWELPPDIPEFDRFLVGATIPFGIPVGSEVAVGITVLFPGVIPQYGYYCGSDLVDWENYYNCVVLHELRHAYQNFYISPEYIDTEVGEIEAENYAAQNYQLIKVIEAKEFCGSRAVIFDKSQRISINEEGLNTIAQDLGINPGCLYIKLEDIDHTLWPTFVGGSYIDSLSRDVWLLTFKIPSSEYFERGCVNCCPFPYPPVHYYPEIINCSVVGTLRGLWHEINDPEEEAYSGNARNRDIDQYILQKRGIMVISVD